MSNHFINKETIENVMNRVYPHTEREEIYHTSKTLSFMKRLVITAGSNTHFVISNNGLEKQSPSINISGNVSVVKKIFRESGFTVSETSSISHEFINHFIDKVNDLVLERFKPFDEKMTDYSFSQKVGSYNFKLNIKKLLLIKDEKTIVERCNCELGVSKGTFLESVKFKIHEDEFIRGNFRQNVEDVKFDFFKVTLKRIFLNSHKNMIESNGLAEYKKPHEVNDEDYESLKEIVKMILI